MLEGCSKIRRVLAKSRLILDEMCRLYGKFASYLRRVLCKTRLIFPRINGPVVIVVVVIGSRFPSSPNVPPFCFSWGEALRDETKTAARETN